LRVGLFTESYDPVINGVSTSVKTLAAELSLGGHRPCIVAPSFPGFVDEPGADIVRLASWRTPFNPRNPFAFPPLGPLPAALRAAQFDIIHTQQPFGIGLHGLRASKVLGVPLLSTFHTLYHEYAHYFPVVPTSVARAFLARHLSRYYNQCATVIVPSRAAGSYLESIGVDPRRLAVIPTGVPAPPTVLPLAITEARRRFDLPEGMPIVLFVGRLAQEKNLALLIDAFVQLPQTDALLLLVGSGPFESQLRLMVRQRRLEERVRFAGFLARGELSPIYEASTVFAFPSPTETQGVVLSEAQSHGLPCVVIAAGGAPEFVRPDIDALLVRPDEGVAGFARAIESLLTDERRRRAFAQAARESELRPTPEGMARQVLALYAHALPSPPAPRTATEHRGL
jgi:glycosyltransferase involved in cell wall biosynthesis